VTALEEVKSQGVLSVDTIRSNSGNIGTVYTLHSGRKIMVDCYNTVWIDWLETTWWHGWRIRRALKKAAQ
jgi:hypothetical protein